MVVNKTSISIFTFYKNKIVMKYFFYTLNSTACECYFQFYTFSKTDPSNRPIAALKSDWGESVSISSKARYAPVARVVVPLMLQGVMGGSGRLPSGDPFYRFPCLFRKKDVYLEKYLSWHKPVQISLSLCPIQIII